MNITTITKEDYEADDILATLAAAGRRARGTASTSSPGDRDTIQLVNDDVTLLYPSTAGVSELTRYDRDKVFERYGIEPHQYPEIAALVGETSDNLIGVDKVGEKTAVKWINQYGSLDGHHRATPTRSRASSATEPPRAAARTPCAIADSTGSSPTSSCPSARRPPAPADRRGRRARGLRPTRVPHPARPGLQARGRAAPTSGAEGAAEIAAAPTGPARSEGAHAHRRGAARTGSTTQRGHARRTSASPSRRLDGKVIGLGIASATEVLDVPWQAGRADYAALEEWLASDSPKVLHDAKRAAQGAQAQRPHLRRSPRRHPRRRVAAAAEPHGDERSRDLVSASTSHETHARGRSQPARAATTAVVAGPPIQAWYSLRVAPSSSASSPRARAACSPTSSSRWSSSSSTWSCAVSPSDHDQLSRALRRARREGRRPRGIRPIAEIGREVNLGSPKQLQEVLFDQLGMPKTRANKTGLLDRRRRPGRPAGVEPASRSSTCCCKHRDATKLRQIVETLDKAIDDRPVASTPPTTQTGTATGRISSNDPNLQNIPVRTEEGRRIRAAFQARRGIRDSAHRRLLADRDAHHGAPLRRRRAHRGVQLGRGPAPLRRRAHLRGRARRCHGAACARRSRRCRTASPTGSAPSDCRSSSASTRPRPSS